MKIYKLLILFFIIFFTGCNQQKNSSLPEDLMYKGEPIHPIVITQIQDGDSSRLAPKKIYSIKDTDYISLYRELNLDYKEIINETSFDPETKTVSCKRVYTILDQPEKSYDQYQLIGSYKDNHIIKTISSEINTRATTVRTLGLIKREGDTIQNVGEIGYDASGRGIEIQSFSKNIVRFSGMFKLSDALATIDEKYIFALEYPINYTVSLIFEVDLDSPITNGEYKSQLVGLLLSDDQDDLTSLSSENKKILKLIQNSIGSGKKELNLEETKSFARKIAATFA